jgi:hypothetical protein
MKTRGFWQAMWSEGIDDFAIDPFDTIRVEFTLRPHQIGDRLDPVRRRTLATGWSLGTLRS